MRQFVPFTKIKRQNMLLILGTFASVVFMLILGFIGETISSMFAASDEAEVCTKEETFTKLATA